MTYFCPVNFLSHTGLKKAIAFVLFGLLALVYAEKFFHGHVKKIACEKQGIHVSGKYGNCTICDFQVTKDASLQAYREPGLILFHYPAYFDCRTTVFHSFSDNCTTTRGPPAC